MLAAVGAGWFAGVDEACAAMISSTVVASPGKDAAAYANRHALYHALYPALTRSFKEIAALAA